MEKIKIEENIKPEPQSGSKKAEKSSNSAKSGARSSCHCGTEKQFIGFYAECASEATAECEMCDCEEKLFNDVFRAVEMSRYPLEAMYERLFDCDFKRYVGELRKQFIALGQDVSEFIRDNDIEPRETGEVTKMMQKMSVEVILRSKNSVKRLAEMLLKGMNMGVIAVYHTYNGYQGSKLGEPYTLATRSLEIFNTATEKLRSFL